MTLAQQNEALTRTLQEWLNAKEGESYEFKEWKNRGDFEDLCKYCCALANEGGGWMIIGVSDKRPRKPVGTSAFPHPEQVRRRLVEQFHLRIDFQELHDDSGNRVLGFSVPPRPIGVPMKYKGIYWGREADSLVPVPEERLRAMLNEGGTDFTASVCSGLTMDDLDPDAIEEFRRRWTAKSGSSLTAMTREQLLRDVDVFIDEGLTYAALILFGLPKAVSRHLPQCEIIYEYRATDASGPAQQRREYRRGFFAFQDELWGLIEARNDLSHFQDGLFVFDIPTFDERSVREALLNAISHRDYQLGGSIFVRQRPRRLSIESPGGLPLGITVDNIYDRQNPRNRRICEVLSRCGLVERAGQGMNLIFEQCIQQGKQPPDFTGTDQYQVVLSLDGRIQDPRFVTFMQKVGSETATSFSTDDFLVLSLVHQEKRVPDALSQSVRKLVELGVIERIGRGRSASCILSRRFYSALGKTGVHTRKRHLDRETNKELLVREIVRKRVGCRISELQSVIPYLSRSQIARLLNELREARRVKMVGIKKGAKWLPGSQATHESKKRKSSASYSRK